MTDDHNLPDDCDHWDAAIDILTGRATCYECGHTWYLTAADIEAEERSQAAYNAYCARLERRVVQARRPRVFLRGYRLPRRRLGLPRLRHQLAKRQRAAFSLWRGTDAEIPF